MSKDIDTALSQALQATIRTERYAPEGLTAKQVTRIEGVLYAWGEYVEGSKTYSPSEIGLSDWRYEEGLTDEERIPVNKTDCYTHDTFDRIQTIYRSAEDIPKKAMRYVYRERLTKARAARRLEMDSKQFQVVLDHVWLKTNRAVDWETAILA